MISLNRQQRIAPPADSTLLNDGRASAPSGAETVNAPTLISQPADVPQLSESDDFESGDNIEEVEDTILRWFPVFLGGWGLLIISLRYL